MELPSEVDPDLSGYGEIADMNIVAELCWDGLRKSVKEGYRTQQEAEELFHTWFSKRRSNEASE